MKRPNVERMRKYNNQPTAYPAPRPYVEDEVYRTFAMEAFHSRLYKEWRDWFEKEMQIKHGDRTGVIDLTFSSGQHYNTVHAKLTWRPLYPAFPIKFPKIELRDVNVDFKKIFTGVKFDRDTVLGAYSKSDVELMAEAFDGARTVRKGFTDGSTG